jgi:hypothetical protein
MANTHTTLQLELPCKLAEAAAWWEEVNRVMGEDSEAQVGIIDHADGHSRLTVHVTEQT